jgi:hypothetical protein
VTLNYFNYFTEIEDTFVRRRGKHLFLSSIDWALMETWKEQGIPLHIVLRAIEKAFDSYESRPRKRSVKTLLYCQEEVEAQHAEWLESRLGAADEPAAEAANEKSPFSYVAVSEHLKHSRLSLAELTQQRRASIEDDDLTEAFERATTILTEIETDLRAGEALDTRRLEDSLTGLERMIKDAMFAVITPEALESVKANISEKIKPFRKQMDKTSYQQTFDNLLLKQLREQFGIPRLSLFYV